MKAKDIEIGITVTVKRNYGSACDGMTGKVLSFDVTKGKAVIQFLNKWPGSLQRREPSNVELLIDCLELEHEKEA